MILAAGDKVHVIYRALYEHAARRHFVGEILAAEAALCRIEGYVFVYDHRSTMYVRKPEKRTTIIDLAESGYIVNLISQETVIDEIIYKYKKDDGLIATDGKSFNLNINEFGSKS